MALRLKLTDAQVSALECAGLDEELPLLLAGWDGRQLSWQPADTEALVSELIDRANAEDALAERREDGWRFAAGACRALSALAGRVSKRNRPAVALSA